MDQAVHIIVLILLVIAIAMSSLCVWMLGFTPSRSTRIRTIALWVALIATFVFVLYNPGAIPGLLRSIPLPPNPFSVG